MGGASKHNQKGGLHMLSLYYLTDLVLDANDIQFMNLFVSSSGVHKFFVGCFFMEPYAHCTGYRKAKS